MKLMTSCGTIVVSGCNVIRDLQDATAVMLSFSQKNTISIFSFAEETRDLQDATAVMLSFSQKNTISIFSFAEETRDLQDATAVMLSFSFTKKLPSPFSRLMRNRDFEDGNHDVACW
jgi:hypothetical protein